MLYDSGGDGSSQPKLKEARQLEIVLLLRLLTKNAKQLCRVKSEVLKQIQIHQTSEAQPSYRNPLMEEQTKVPVCFKMLRHN